MARVMFARRGTMTGLAALAFSRQSFGATVTAKITAQALVDSPWDHHWDEFKANIAKRSDFELEYYIRGETGNEEQMLTALRRNRVQIGGITMWGLAGIIPESAVPMLPYLFDSEAEVDFVFDNFLAEPFSGFLREKGLALLHWSEVGWSNLYSKRPVKLPADIRGMKVRGLPISPPRPSWNRSAPIRCRLGSPTSRRHCRPALWTAAYQASRISIIA